VTEWERYLIRHTHLRVVEQMSTTTILAPQKACYYQKPVKHRAGTRGATVVERHQVDFWVLCRVVNVINEGSKPPPNHSKILVRGGYIICVDDRVELLPYGLVKGQMTCLAEIKGYLGTIREGQDVYDELAQARSDYDQAMKPEPEPPLDKVGLLVDGE